MFLIIKLWTHAKLNCLKLKFICIQMSSALNNPQRLIWHKPKQTSKINHVTQFSNGFIPPIDGILTGTTTPTQSEPGRTDDKWVITHKVWYAIKPNERLHTTSEVLFTKLNTSIIPRNILLGLPLHEKTE